MVCILLLAVVCPAFCLPQTGAHSCCHHQDNASNPCGSAAMHGTAVSPAVLMPVVLAGPRATTSALNPHASYAILPLTQKQLHPSPPKVLTVLRI
jgi:hypothetical protein